MKVSLIFGFLGSGKTTLLRHILAERAAKQSMAVIVNEFGEVGIDGAILAGNNVDMVELNSGCLCCTLKGPLLNAVEELRDRAGVGHTVIEASGLAHPEEMEETFANPRLGTTVDVGPYVTVVDGHKFARLRQGLGEFYVDQVAYADVILLNKADLMSADEMEILKKEINAINPDAEILVTERCDVDPGSVLDSRKVAEKAAQADPHHSPGHSPLHSHESFDSLVLNSGADAARGRVQRFFSGLAPNVLRAKGFMTIDGRLSLVQYAAGQLEIEDNPAASATQDPARQMVFIGEGLNRAALESEFAFARRKNGNGTEENGT